MEGRSRARSRMLSGTGLPQGVSTRSAATAVIRNQQQRSCPLPFDQPEASPLPPPGVSARPHRPVALVIHAQQVQYPVLHQVRISFPPGVLFPGLRGRALAEMAISPESRGRRRGTRARRAQSCPGNMAFSRRNSRHRSPGSRNAAARHFVFQLQREGLQPCAPQGARCAAVQHAVVTFGCWTYWRRLRSSPGRRPDRRPRGVASFRLSWAPRRGLGVPLVACTIAAPGCAAPRALVEGHEADPSGFQYVDGVQKPLRRPLGRSIWVMSPFIPS